MKEQNSDGDEGKAWDVLDRLTQSGSLEPLVGSMDISAYAKAISS